jgi:hypothetical protein
MSTKKFFFKENKNTTCSITNNEIKSSKKIEDSGNRFEEINNFIKKI